MEPKTISLDEANRMLPLLRQIVGDIMSSWEKIIEKRTELECAERGIRSDGQGTQPRDPLIVQQLKVELNYLIDKINHYIREVEALGCFVEEFKRGIVNFPSLFNGRRVFLCWGPDEKSVRYWHEIDETYADRVEIRNEREFMVTNPHVR
ncbi:MAG TPA: DUF2203 domain-containing protein [Planctomycetota bacterium]|nr:DUF2203 domain-containing protein [Planctomycetota bacterium]